MPKVLSEMIADDILYMINVEKRFDECGKLPNENDFAKELNVNRATLREAIRILATNGVLEIKRGVGTFIKKDSDTSMGDMSGISAFADKNVDVRDLYEMRIVIEPEAAFFATQRATETELKNILYYGDILEKKLVDNTERALEEQNFHKAIAKATHNMYMNKLIPALLQVIYIAVKVTQDNSELRIETIRDHRLIMDFMSQRDAEGAKTAMRLHMLHAVRLMENNMYEIKGVKNNTQSCSTTY
ncbi:FCD domain-containing protein [Lachnospiraceae bacterium NSJ-143]|nr:FCD domain-containing protein [Lachnospiraceae bacterium NSJ-143]